MAAVPEDFLNLSVPDRIALAQALWDSIGDRPRPPLSEAKQAELARRAAEDDARPDDAIPWAKVKADILARLGRT